MSATVEKTNGVQSITPNQAQQLLQTGEGVIIDVRTGLEYAQCHAVGVEHVPLDSLNVSDVVARHPGKTIICLCKAGTRGGKAAQQLVDAGCCQVANIAGGTDAWIAAGLPVERRSGVISLERQVRIAAGTLVLFSVVLGYFVHVAFLGVTAFVGGGLIFAGITDFCGMGLLIAKMPWNQNLNKKCEGATCAVS